MSSPGKMEAQSMALQTEKKSELWRILKFGLVGVLNTIVGYGAFFILSYFLSYLVALIISHVIGVIHSYIWNKFWTFGTEKNYSQELLRFSSVYLVVLVANIVILAALVDGLHLNPRIGQLLVLPIVTMISYFGHRFWSFGAAGR